MRYARATKLAGAVVGVGLLVGTMTMVPAGAGPIPVPPIPSLINNRRPPGIPTPPIDTNFGSVLGGGDELRLPFSGGTDAYVTVGAHRTVTGLMGQVAQTNVATKGNDKPGDQAIGSFTGDVVCLQVIGNQAYVTVRIRHASGFWADRSQSNPDRPRYEGAEYLLTDNHGNAPDSVTSGPLVNVPTATAMRTNCGFTSQRDFPLNHGRIEVNPG